jgi:hypothetical protein
MRIAAIAVAFQVFVPASEQHPTVKTSAKVPKNSATSGATVGDTATGCNVVYHNKTYAAAAVIEKAKTAIA